MKYLLYLTFFFSTVSNAQDSLNIKHLYQEAMAYEDKGDLDNALKTQLKLFKLDSSNYPSANVIAGLYGKEGLFSKEVHWATIAITINPNFSDGYVNLGNGYAGLVDLSSAEENFKIALKLDTLSPFPYYSLGVIEENRNNLNAAVVYYEKSVAVDSTFENGYFNLAAAYANLKDFKKANENISKALALNPNDKDAQEMYVHIIDALLK